MEEQPDEDQGFRLSWAQEYEVDLSDTLASIDEINIGFQRQVVGVTITEYYNRKSLPNFPICLSLNRACEEPPYPRCIQRAIPWRRIMSCIEPALRPDYYLTNNPEAKREGYSNVTWRIGNICVQVVAATNARLISIDPAGPNVTPTFKSPPYQQLADDDLLQLRIIGHKNLCVLGLLLLLKYLDHAWTTTYHLFVGEEHYSETVNQLRMHAVAAVHSQVRGQLVNLVRMVRGKQTMNMSNQFLETEPIFDSDVLRMYMWDLIMVYDEYIRGAETANGDYASIIEEFTNNAYRDRPGSRAYFLQPRMREALHERFSARTIPWSGNYELDRWEFVRHQARMENREPVFSNPDLLQNMRAAYGTPGARAVEPSFQNRRTYSNFIDMQRLRRSDGIWDFDEPFRNEEVDVFRMFLLWKVGSQWRALTQERPAPAYLPSTAMHNRMHGDHISINAGGRDANQFQPSLPVAPATKTKNPPKVKKPPADSRPKSDRPKKVKNPVNVELPIP